MWVYHPKDKIRLQWDYFENILQCLIDIGVGVLSQGVATAITEESLTNLPIFDVLMGMGVGVSFQGEATPLRG